MPGTNLKLNGQFKFDLYTPQGELIKTSEYIDNFITNSGVLYPFHFAFADCFRFLSVGIGTTPNSILITGLNPATTGLASPLTGYSYIGSRQFWESGQNSTYYATPGNFGAGCGYTNNTNGVSLIRQWNLPDNTGGVFTGSQTFNEFMVSPGRPYVTGFEGVKLCSCAESDSTNTATGLDCSSTAEYYNWLSNIYATQNNQTRLKICDADKAFARVLYEFNVTSGSILTITYNLNIIVDTGIHYTSLPYIRNDSDTNWNYQINSYNTITQPGVMLINDGTIFGSTAPNGNQRLQHFDYNPSDNRLYSFDNEYGESFVPPFGAPLEPSNFFLLNQPANQNIVVYFSNDNLQFLVNPSGGAFYNTGNYAPWNIWSTGNILNTYSLGNIVTSGDNSYQYININPSSGNLLTNTSYWNNIGAVNNVYPFSSGVKQFKNNNLSSIVSGAGYWSQSPNDFNIRMNSGFAPSTGDITKSVNMSSNSFYSVKANLPAFSLNYIGNTSTNGTRSGQVLYVYNFQNYPNTSGLAVKSFVASYQDLGYGSSFGLGDNENLVPFFDSVFSGASGSNVWLPSLLSGSGVVNNGTGVVITGIDYNITDYNYLQNFSNSLYPIFNNVLSWSVPCPNGVIGC